MARLSALVGWASWVEEQETIFVLQEGYVRVAEDYRAGLGEASAKAPTTSLLAPRVVDHGYSRAAEVELQRLGELHFGWIHVAPDGADRSVCGELVEHRWLEQIPRMQDKVRLRKVRNQLLRQGAGAARYVRVGEDNGQEAQWPTQ